MRSRRAGGQREAPPNPARRGAAWDLAALLAGGSLPLAFAPFSLSAWAVAPMTVLFASWLCASPWRAAWRGLLFGAGMFGVGVSWVYVSLHTYGRMPAPLAAIAVAVFVLLLSLFPAAVGFAQAKLVRPASMLRPGCAAPALWVLGEWAREWVLTGFPWLSLGYSQTESPLFALAPLVGVYGLSLVVVASAGAVVLAWYRRTRVSMMPLAGLLVVWLAAVPLGGVQWVRPVNAPLAVALVQGNVGLDEKWAPERQAEIVDLYLGLSAAAPEAQLIVWPEAALPLYRDALPDRLWDALQGMPSDFLFGVLEREPSATGMSVYNSVAGVGADGAVQIYRKRHLVPFGEYLPLRPLFAWVLDYLHIPMADFLPGDGARTALVLAGNVVGVSVCYEDAFAAEVLAAVPKATLLANVSEDAWFGASLAPHQRLQMARMRAREAGRAMLRAGNTGISAVIDHRGAVLERSPQFRTVVLTATVQPMAGETPFARYRHLPAVLVSLLLTLASAWLARYRPRG